MAIPNRYSPDAKTGQLPTEALLLATKPLRLDVTIDKKTISADGVDVATITVAVLDQLDDAINHTGDVHVRVGSTKRKLVFNNHASRSFTFVTTTIGKHSMQVEKDDVDQFLTFHQGGLEIDAV